MSEAIDKAEAAWLDDVESGDLAKVKIVVDECFDPNELLCMIACVLLGKDDPVERAALAKDLFMAQAEAHTDGMRARGEFDYADEEAARKRACREC